MTGVLTSFSGGYALAGGGVGLLVGMTGVGGGSLMTPLLIILFGIHPMTAVGTDLLQASATKAVGSLVHGAHRNVDWRIAARLLSGSLPAAIATLIVLRFSAADTRTLAHLIKLVLGVALLLTALSLAFRPWLLRTAERRIGVPSPRTASRLTVLTGAVIGMLVALSSVGAGAIGMAVLLFLYPGVPVAKLVGSDIAHAVPLTLVAGAGHIFFGAVDWPLLFSLLVGSVPGIIAGSFLAVRVPEPLIRVVLAGILAVVGAQMVR